MRGATVGSIPNPATISDFNPRAPCGARPSFVTDIDAKHLHFNPRAPCGARLHYRLGLAFGDGISIHAPHAGRDREVSATSVSMVLISIHAPHAGRDPQGANIRHGNASFQSTRPMRGATKKNQKYLYHHSHFNPRAPCGARRVYKFVKDWLPWYFNPRAPCGARLQVSGSACEHFRISIHAPHAGRDSKSEQIALHIFAKKAWIPDIFAQNAAFQSVLPLADRQKLLYLRCEPLRKFLRAFASHYKIIGSSGR